MSIDESVRYLRLMLGGMKYAVKYWADKDKEESDIEQTNVEAVKTALDTMRKYQKIQEIMDELNGNFYGSYLKDRQTLEKIYEVVEDGNDNN